MSDMTIASIEEKEFDRLTPVQLQNHEGLRAAMDSNVHAQVQSVTRGAFGGKATVAFRTRYDVMGLLQVEGVQGNPPGVKIRYKLVQREATPGRHTLRIAPPAPRLGASENPNNADPKAARNSKYARL